MRLILLSFFIGFNLLGYSQNKDLQKSNEWIKAEALRQEGHAFFNKKEYEVALKKYKKSLKEFIIISDSSRIAKCYNNIGNSQLFLGNNEKAIVAFYNAIEINKRLNNSTVLIGNYINLAAYYKRQKEYDLALKYYLDAKDEVAKANDPAKLPLIYLGLGDILGKETFESHNFNLAKSYYRKALSSYMERKDSARISIVYNNLGVLSYHQLEYDSSLFFYTKSIELKDGLGDQRGQIILFLNVGNIYMEKGNYRIALDYFNQGADLAVEFEDNVNYHNLIANTLKCKIQLGQREEADSIFEIYNSLTDSIYDKEKAKNLKELEVLYETQKIGNDLKDQIKQTEAKTRLSYWYLALAVGITLLFFIAILFFNQNRKYHQTLKVQELERLKKAQEIKELNAMMQGQEDERNRIAEDLHDRLGARLSAIKLLALKDGKKSLAISEMVESAIKETREISHNLSTDMLTRFGLQNAISDFVRTVNESNKIEGDFTTTNLEERLPKVFEKTIFHVVLELVNNTIRHSDASSFFIQLTRYQNEIDLIYEDDGSGFDAKKTSFEGMGIRNLTARVQSINGKINIDSMPGKGVHVVISASLKKELA